MQYLLKTIICKSMRMKKSHEIPLIFNYNADKSVILIGPFQISGDNNHAVDDISTISAYNSACVKTPRVVGSRRLTRCVKTINAIPHTLRDVAYARIEFF